MTLSRKSTAMAPGGLSVVSVTHGGELGLLGLQARSLARYLAGAGVDAVHVHINDRNEAAVRARVEALRPEYGPLADRLRIFGSADTLWRPADAPHPRSARAAIYRLAARHPWMQLIHRGGWNGNDGWRVQQAFKLAAARAVETPYIMYLDTKNVFLGAMERSDFVASDGRARSWFSGHIGKSAWWLAQSQRALGQAARPVPAEITSFVTPFVVETALVRELLRAFEARNGPVEDFFAFRLNNATEFMLINAWCNATRGGVRAVFADGLVRSHTVWGARGLLDSVLAEAVAERSRCIGLHRQALPRLGPSHRAIISKLLLRAGLLDDADAFDRLIAAETGKSQDAD